MELNTLGDGSVRPFEDAPGLRTKHVLARLSRKKNARSPRHTMTCLLHSGDPVRATIKSKGHHVPHILEEAMFAALPPCRGVELIEMSHDI